MGRSLSFLRIVAASVGLFFCLFLSSAYAAESSLSIDKNKPVELIADSLTVDDTGQTAVFSGDVQVIQGGVRLNAQAVTIYYSRGSGKASGSAASAGDSPFAAGSQVKLIKASGGAVIFSDKERLKGRDMVYDLASGLITVTGGVTLSNPNGTLRGEKIIFEVKNKKATLVGGKSGRVRGLVTPTRDQ